MGSQISCANLPLCGLGSFCRCYCKVDHEEVIKTPVELAKIRNKEYEEYIQNSKPKKYMVLYRLNRPDDNKIIE
jgi:hypothetical protein